MSDHTEIRIHGVPNHLAEKVKTIAKEKLGMTISDFLKPYLHKAVNEYNKEKNSIQK